MSAKKPLRALIVEDSEFDARMLVNVLRQGGYDPAYRQVDTAPALRAALAEQVWDIIFADYNMPEFTAPAALKIVQESGLDLPFIVVSGGIGEDVAVSVMKAGAHDYLMKGNLARLAPAVERELREARTRAARQTAEAALRESELRYRLVWENSTDAVLLLDADATIHFANPAVETIFGYPPAEVVGRKLSQLQSAGAAHAPHLDLSHPLADAAAETKRRVVETAGRRKDGEEIAIEIGFSELELHGQRWVVAFIRDITERLRAEQELRAHEEQFRVAREIQQRLFPKSAPALPGFDIAGATYPAEATGGDYFDYLQMLNGRLGIVVADVTGHGVGPALLMAETRAYLRVLARNRDDAGEILTRANRVLAEDVDYERFVTLMLVRLDPETRAVAYCSAGHPNGYLLDATGRLKSLLKRTGVPLGIQPELVYASAVAPTLSPGDILVLLTDGIEEAMSPQNELFGAQRILDALHAHAGKPAREMVEGLYNTVRHFSGNRAPLDDLTVVVVKALPAR